MEEGYTYNKLQIELKKLKEKFPFIEIGNIGYSVLGREIPYIRIGVGEKEVFYNASFHANEWINTPVLMKYINEYAIQYSLNGKLLNFNARELYNAISLYIVPMVNPDGVDLVTGGLKTVDNPYKNAQIIANNFPEIPFPNGWKANINGVDLKIYQPVHNFTNCDTNPFVHFPILLFLHFALV